jgi:hypothetical protein
MTTVVDPGTANEFAVFNLGSTAILNAVVDPVTANYDIPAIAGRVIVLATKAANTGSATVTLSPSFQVGDEVWVTGENSSSWGIIDENGTTIITMSTGTTISLMKVKTSATAPRSTWIAIT